MANEHVKEFTNDNFDTEAGALTDEALAAELRTALEVLVAD